MPAHSEFFGTRDAKAVLKHGLLARYAKYFAGRAGHAAGGRVAFIDGYAGKGRYDDGNPGSPLLLATQAEGAETFGRDVRLAFVEQDDDLRSQLTETLASENVEADQILGGDFDRAVDGLLQRYSDRAVLMFVDPFGLAISREALVRILKGRSRGRPIDVLYHFSLSSVARQGALGVTAKRGAAVSAAQLDAALGSAIWRGPFEVSSGADGAATEAALTVARGFAAEVAFSAGVLTTSIPVRRRPEHLPTYLLTFFSADRKAHWGFADMAGKTYVDWLHHCDHEEFEANLQSDRQSGILRLIEDSEPEIGKIDQLVAEEAEDYFAGHLPAVLEQHGSLRPIDHFEELYGAMVGRARERDLHSAFKHLYRQGRTDDNATGKNWMDRQITWLGHGSP